MKTGLFGTFNEEDTIQDFQRAILELRRNAEEAESVLGMGNQHASWPVQQIPAGATTHHLCVIKISGQDHSHEEMFLGVENQDRAIAMGILWARHQLAQLKATGRIAEMRITRLLMTGKADTLAGTPCFEWKSSGPTTLAVEYDKAVSAQLLAKLNELEKCLRRIEQNQIE